MSNPERVLVPALTYIDVSEPSPMKKLKLNRSIATTLKEELGREPTEEECVAAYKEALGGLALENIAEQKKYRAEQARKIIQELTPLAEEDGGNNE